MKKAHSCSQLNNSTRGEHGRLPPPPSIVSAQHMTNIYPRPHHYSSVDASPPPGLPLFIIPNKTRGGEQKDAYGGNTKGSRAASRISNTWQTSAVRAGTSAEAAAFKMSRDVFNALP